MNEAPIESTAEIQTKYAKRQRLSIDLDTYPDVKEGMARVMVKHPGTRMTYHTICALRAYLLSRRCLPKGRKA
jgi:hypothetical protein